jgi:cell division protein FtsN
MAKPKRRITKRGAKKGTGSAWLWIITGCLILVLIAFLLMMTREQRLAEPVAPNYPITSAPKEPKPIERKFEFYERLPEMRVTVPGTEPPPPPPETVPTERFMLQIAAVKDFNEADALKAELTLLGFPVKIEAVTINDQPSYRILSGPFPDHASAAVAQQELQSMHFDSQIMKE